MYHPAKALKEAKKKKRTPAASPRNLPDMGHNHIEVDFRLNADFDIHSSVGLQLVVLAAPDSQRLTHLLLLPMTDQFPLGSGYWIVRMIFSGRG